MELSKIIEKLQVAMVNSEIDTCSETMSNKEKGDALLDVMRLQQAIANLQNVKNFQG